VFKSEIEWHEMMSRDPEKRRRGKILATLVDES
jgi:hypothetical protein